MITEYFINHPQINDPNFSKVYSKYRRLNHHYLYLKCLFLIEEINSSEPILSIDEKKIKTIKDSLKIKIIK